jgi:hypothetical protein
MNHLSGLLLTAVSASLVSAEDSPHSQLQHNATGSEGVILLIPKLGGSHTASRSIPATALAIGTAALAVLAFLTAKLCSWLRRQASTSTTRTIMPPEDNVEKDGVVWLFLNSENLSRHCLTNGSCTGSTTLVETPRPTAAQWETLVYAGQVV